MRQITLITDRFRITTLELPRCEMKGPDAARLAGVLAQCPALAHLDLSGNYNFAAEGAERLAGVLAQSVVLTHLKVDSNGIGYAERVLQECWAVRSAGSPRSLRQ
jgi:hypothetical protein